MGGGQRSTARIFVISHAFESSNHELFDFLHNVPHKKSNNLEHSSSSACTVA